MTLFEAAEEDAVRGLLAEMERPVELALVLGPEEEPLPGPREMDFSAEARRLVEGVAALGDLVTTSIHDAPAFGVDHHPAICVLPNGEDVGLRYLGLPWGYELTSLIGACYEAGKHEPTLSAPSRAALATLERDLAVEVYVTPT